MERQPGAPWTTKDLSEATGLEYSGIRKMLLAGRLEGFKAGRDWLVPDDVARRFIEERQAKQDKSGTTY